MLPLMAILGAAGLIGKIAGGAGKGMADQRFNENMQTDRQNSLLTSIYNTQQNAKMNAALAGSREQSDQAGIDLDRRKYALAAPSARSAQAVRGNLLQNIQPVTFEGLPDRIASRMPTMTGGLTPAALGPEARQIGAMIARQAVLDQLKGDAFTPLKPTNFNDAVMPAPQLEDYQKSGLFEKILGGLGLGGSLAGGVEEIMNGRRRRPTSGNDLPIDPVGGS